MELFRAILQLKIKFLPLLWGMLLFMLSSCNKSRVLYSYYHRIQGEEWHVQDERFFSFFVEDTTANYEVKVALRYKPEITALDIPIGVIIETPAGNYLQGETSVSLPTRRELQHQGYHLYQADKQLESHWRFQQKGIYTYSLLPLLKDSVITGIVELGLIVTKQN